MSSINPFLSTPQGVNEPLGIYGDAGNPIGDDSQTC